MGVLTFLKKAGEVLVDAGSVVELGYPIFGRALPKSVQPAVATAVSDLETFAGVVTEVERIGQSLPQQLNGAQKFSLALPAITRVIAQSSVVAGKKIANQQLFAKACEEGAQFTVDLLNSLDPDSVVSTPLPFKT